MKYLRKKKGVPAVHEKKLTCLTKLTLKLNYEVGTEADTPNETNIQLLTLEPKLQHYQPPVNTHQRPIGKGSIPK